MSTLESIILGIVQGITEFLPISSSGHLVIFQRLLGLKEPQLIYNVFLHFGTLIAVLIFYWKDIKRLLSLDPKHNKERFLIIMASIPTAIIGFGLKDIFESLFGSILAVGVALVVTGLLLWLVENLDIKFNKSILDLSWFHVILIGIAQGMAITPGVSRSGSTIVAGLLLGLGRKEAARFSFLIFIPAVLGATLLETLDVIQAGVIGINTVALFTGMIISTIVGYLSIKFLLKLLENENLNYFAYYVWGIGVLILILNFN
ncbi:undecaprenyl-diphosphate phosphatase [Selenihalanaerobacter shriftii]|uniref:Undecaprenyl-diphosphatase n=1 Tax=Selenihalanaerobacter shriftii TaxID=142842 RepID=A0A1T4JMU1_9FIRM|nr:undecaprenyl-diphosphate phosphatase [Selenihalanaerobacter shriftii]SJZ31509.1 undecaprenyl-diphosphatase [Selenihalanaerobacter shriftii]